MAGKFEKYQVRGLIDGDVEFLAELSDTSSRTVRRVLTGELNSKHVHTLIIKLAQKLAEIRGQLEKQIEVKMSGYASKAKKELLDSFNV